MPGDRRAYAHTYCPSRKPPPARARRRCRCGSTRRLKFLMFLSMLTVAAAIGTGYLVTHTESQAAKPGLAREMDRNMRSTMQGVHRELTSIVSYINSTIAVLEVDPTLVVSAARMGRFVAKSALPGSDFLRWNTVAQRNQTDELMAFINARRWPNQAALLGPMATTQNGAMRVEPWVADHDRIMLSVFAVDNNGAPPGFGGYNWVAADTLRSLGDPYACVRFWKPCAHVIRYSEGITRLVLRVPFHWDASAPDGTTFTNTHTMEVQTDLHLLLVGLHKQEAVGCSVESVMLHQSGLRERGVLAQDSRYQQAVSTSSCVSEAMPFSNLTFHFVCCALDHTLHSMVSDRHMLLGAITAIAVCVFVSLAVCVVNMRHRARTAARANKHKTKFLSYLLHEIRNPLHSLMAIIEAVQEYHAGQPCLPTAEYRASMGTLATNMHLTLNDVLDIRTMESGHVVRSLAPRSIPSMYAELDIVYRTRAGVDGLRWHAEVGDDVPGTIFTDGPRVMHCMHNLLNNSFKYCRRGSVTLRWEMDADARLVVSVADTGCGISAEQMKLLFCPYLRVGSQTDQINGTGLGLYMVKSICDMLEIDIQLHSTEKEATMVCMRFPRWSTDNIAAEQLKATGPNLSPSRDSPQRRLASTRPGQLVRVLVVEDNLLSNKLLCRMISSMRVGLVFTVHPAFDGKQAVDAFRKNPFDIVFMDVQMPVMDGLTASKLIRSHDVHVPIVVTTANALTQDRQGFESMGITHELINSFARADLLGILERVFGDCVDLADTPKSSPHTSNGMDAYLV